MRYLPLAFLALAGCTMSASGLSKTEVEQTLTSTKSPQAFATCAAETMIGNPQLRGEGDHYWILRMNGYGVPTARWDFTATGTGSRAELRSSIPVNTGDERVKACA